MKKIGIYAILLILIIGIIFTHVETKKRIVKADNETSIQFMYKDTLTSSDLDTLNGLFLRENNGIWQTTYNYNDIEYTIKINYVYYFLRNTTNPCIEYHAIGQAINNYVMLQILYYQNNEFWEIDIQSNSIGLTDSIFLEQEWQVINSNIQNNSQWQDLKNILWKDYENTSQLETPTIELEWQTITWQAIENAEYYNIYRNGTLIGTTQNTQWVTITNGTYTIQACTTNEEYINSELSNSVVQDRYNDLIGNGANWYTLMSAWVDSNIVMLKAFLNYEIWGINFFKLFQLIITIILMWFIVKFVIGKIGS